MKTTDMLVIGVILLIAAAAAAGATKGKKGTAEKPAPKGPLTEREQAMFFRLQQAFPDLVVVPQMAFSALLTAKTTPCRNTFDRKVADFVLCSKAFEVICAIELDDASHKGKRAEDAKRDAMLKAAGYKVARFKNVPDVEPLKATIKALIAPPSQVKK